MDERLPSRVGHGVGRRTFLGAAAAAVGAAAALDRSPAAAGDSAASEGGLVSPGSQGSAGAPVEVESVTATVPFKDDYPVANVIDGNPHSWAWPAGPNPSAQNQPITYTFTLAQPAEVSGLRFWQHYDSYATRYRVQADVDGEGGFTRTLAEADDLLTPAGEWAGHGFDPVVVHAVRFEALSGYANQHPYPALSGFELLTVAPAPVDLPAVRASVSPNTVLDINGQVTIPDTIFSVGAVAQGPKHPVWPEVTRDAEFFQQYIAPLNLGVIPTWATVMFGDELIPEDPDAPGRFDREFFSSGEFTRQILRPFWLESFEAIRESGAALDLRLIGMPKFMQSDIELCLPEGVSPSLEAIPARDPEDWGEFAAEIVRAVNHETDGFVRWVHIWNEPNNQSRFAVYPPEQRPSEYRAMYGPAASVIAQAHPTIKIGGPVVAGGGVLAGTMIGYVGDDADGNHICRTLGGGSGRPTLEGRLHAWNEWMKPFVDEVGELADHYDAHCYSTDAANAAAESHLLASYSQRRLGRTLPVIVTEGAPHLASRIINVDPLASAWRSLVVTHANLLVNLLDMPDRWQAFSYFTLQAGGGAPEAQAGSLFNLDFEAQPIYWLYWLIRNLRGQRLHAACDDEAVNLVAARNGDAVHLVAQNLLPHPRQLTISFDRPVDKQAKVDFLEYDPDSASVDHGQRDATVTGRRVLSIDLAPFGVYAATVPIAHPNVPTITVARTDHYGDQEMQELPPNGEVHMSVEVPRSALRGDTFTLNFGTLGIPDSNNKVRFNHQVPLRIDVNGTSHDTLAGKWNGLTLHRRELKEGGIIDITFQRRDPTPEEAPRAVDPDQLWITSASILTTAPPTRRH